MIAEVLVQKAIQAQLNKLKAIIDPNNLPSRKILMKLGFQFEKICKVDGLLGEILIKDLKIN